MGKDATRLLIVHACWSQKMFLLPSLSGKKAGKEQLFSFQNQLIGVPHLPALTFATAITIVLIVKGLSLVTLEVYKSSKFQARKLNCIRFTLRKFSWGTSGLLEPMPELGTFCWLAWNSAIYNRAEGKTNFSYRRPAIPTFSAGSRAE